MGENTFGTWYKIIRGRGFVPLSPRFSFIAKGLPKSAVCRSRATPMAWHGQQILLLLKANLRIDSCVKEHLKDNNNSNQKDKMRI